MIEGFRQGDPGRDRGARRRRHYEQKLSHLRSELRNAKKRRAEYEVKTGEEDDWGNWLIDHYDQQLEKTLQKMRDIERRGGL